MESVLVFIVSIAIFSVVILLLVGALLFVESKVLKKGDSVVTINENEEKKLSVRTGITLLSALSSNNILIPSACGGKGTCGTCKCAVDDGGGDLLPTELSHISRKEMKDNVRLACQLKIKQDMKIRIPEEFFSIKKYNATVVSNRNVATFIKELVLKLEGGDRLKFKAGAYIQIDIPEYKCDYKDFSIEDRYRSVWDQFNLWNIRAAAEEPVFRAYSLANPPMEGEVLKFTIRIATPPPGKDDIPAGIGSSFIFSLKAGDRVTLSGPYGDFFVKDTNREMCFIGGGAGMAPMRSHILNQLLDVRTKRKVTFWYGARSVQEMFYDEEFKELERNNDNFSYTVALSDPLKEDNWKGSIGFIHQVLHDEYLKMHEDPTEIEYYLCGPPLMIAAVKKMLHNIGVEPEMIAFDDFG